MVYVRLRVDRAVEHRDVLDFGDRSLKQSSALHLRDGLPIKHLPGNLVHQTQSSCRRLLRISRAAYLYQLLAWGLLIGQQVEVDFLPRRRRPSMSFSC